MEYKVALCQFNPLLSQPEKNRKRMIDMMQNSEADLMVFPELATCGYSFSSHSELEALAESPATGLTATLFKQIAYEKKCSCVIGFPEKDNDKIYNSSMLVNPDGTIYIYRKTHLFYNEKKLFSPGNTGFQVFQAHKGVRIGMMVCFDWIFPESARTLMLNGAQIIAHPANLVLPWCQRAMITRSLENRVFTITANRTGKEVYGEIENYFTGLSQIVDTKGNVLESLNETDEKIISVVIDPENADDKQITELNNIISDRRIEYYHS